MGVIPSSNGVKTESGNTLLDVSGGWRMVQGCQRSLLFPNLHQFFPFFSHEFFLLIPPPPNMSIRSFGHFSCTSFNGGTGFFLKTFRIALPETPCGASPTRCPTSSPATWTTSSSARHVPQAGGRGEGTELPCCLAGAVRIALLRPSTAAPSPAVFCRS